MLVRRTSRPNVPAAYLMVRRQDDRPKFVLNLSQDLELFADSNSHPELTGEHLIVACFPELRI